MHPDDPRRTPILIDTEAVERFGHAARATIARAAARNPGVRIIEVGENARIERAAVHVHHKAGNAWIHDYEGSGAAPAPPMGRAQAIATVIETSRTTLTLATDLAVTDGAFEDAASAHIVTTHTTALTPAALAKLLDDAYASAYASRRLGETFDTKHRELEDEFRTEHESIAALAAAEALAPSAHSAMLARIATHWDRTINHPRGAIPDGIYLVRVEDGTARVRRDAHIDDLARALRDRA